MTRNRIYNIPPQLRVSKPCSADWKPALFPSRCSTAKIKAAVFGLLPVLSWLPKYKIKDYIVPDLLGGLSGGSIQVPQGEGVCPPGWLGLPLSPFLSPSPVTPIPQLCPRAFNLLFSAGMAFALLANLPAVNGLYSSFFPLLTYFFLGGIHQMVPGKASPLSAGQVTWTTRTGDVAKGLWVFSICILLELVLGGPEGTVTVSVSPRSAVTLKKPLSFREPG